MLINHDNLKTFSQHGFTYIDEASNQVRGNCVFCDSEKFYINPEEKLWDCKVCGLKGGYQRFLHEVNDFCMQTFRSQSDDSNTVANKLSLQRRISLNTLHKHDIGYNPTTERYTIPVYNDTKETLLDLKMYKLGVQIRGTYGCKSDLYGLDSMNKDSNIVWLVEGHWDKIALSEVLNTLNKQENILAVPGANSFKPEWGHLFKDKEVYTLYDHDYDKEIKGKIRQGAGKLGMLKANSILSSIVKQIKFIHWPGIFPDGFDVRDYKNKVKIPKTIYSGLKRLCKELPPGYENTVKEKEKKSVFVDKYLPIDAVYTTYKKWLYLSDTSIIDVIMGTLIANRLCGDPLWLFIVAPSGGTKTELCMSISDAPSIFTTTCLTPHSLISGTNSSGGGDPSLLPKLDGKILVIKDFTTILDMNPNARDEIFGILRDAYDGKTEKMFGNGKMASYKSKFGILAGVTPAIEIYTEGQTALGERFLKYNIKMDITAKGKRELIKKARSNVGKELQMRSEISNIATKFLSYHFNDMPKIPEEIEDRLVDLANFVAQIRGTVIRDKYTKEILYHPFSEVGTRLVKQFTKLLLGIGAARGLKIITDKEYNIIKHLGLSSIPTRLEIIIKALYLQRRKQFDIKEIIDIVKLPTSTCKRLVEDLLLLNALKKEQLTRVRTVYSLHDELIDMIKTGDIY